MTLLASTLGWLTGIGTAAGAIAAAFAAWVAVYVGVIRMRRRRPKLTLDFPSVGRELVVVRSRGGGSSAWIRCQVSNAPGRDAADDVEVAIVDASEISPRDGHPPTLWPPQGLLGLALAWSAAEGQKRAHIAPGAGRIIDVAAAYDTATRPRPLVIQTAFRHVDPNAQELKSAEVQLDLALTARNADAVRYRVRIAYDGEWDENVWDHLKVTLVERV